MTDNILSAVLTFGLLASGTAAIGTEMFNTHRTAPTNAPTHAAMQVVMLPAVTVTGHRTAPTEVVMLPMVTVTGHRAAVQMAYADSGDAQSQVR